MQSHAGFPSHAPFSAHRTDQSEAREGSLSEILQQPAFVEGFPFARIHGKEKILTYQKERKLKEFWFPHLLSVVLSPDKKLLRCPEKPLSHTQLRENVGGGGKKGSAAGELSITRTCGYNQKVTSSKDGAQNTNLVHKTQS